MFNKQSDNSDSGEYHFSKIYPDKTELLRANRAVQNGENINQWLKHLNTYIIQFGITPLKLKGSGEIFERLSTTPPPPQFKGPLVTVIMPVRNVSATLRPSICSILCQTWKNLELLVIDDASTDATSAILRELSLEDPRIKIFTNNSVVGYSASKNIALPYSNGKWVTGHSADAWAHPQWLEKQISEMAKTGSAACLSLMVYMTAKGIFKHDHEDSGDSIDGFLQKAPESCLIEHKIITDYIGFWDTVLLDADNEIIARAKKALGDRFLVNSIFSKIHLDDVTPRIDPSINGKIETDEIASIRSRYRYSYENWLKNINNLNEMFLSFPQEDRKFEAEKKILVPNEKIRKNIGDRKFHKTIQHSRSWELAGGRLTYKHPKMNIFWSVPPDFLMPNESALSLAEYVLLMPHGETTEIVPQTTRKGGRTAVAFSGGVDSTAALELMPNPLPIYTQHFNVKGLLKLENALRSLEEVSGISVVSNYDEFPIAFGKHQGNYGDAGFTVSCILFSDYYEIDTICDGNVLETAYLHGKHGHGTRFGIKDRNEILDAFQIAGINYSMPCAGLTEVSTTKIASDYRFSMGCMRGENGSPCNNCMKCFRKNALKGKPILTNKETEKKLSGELVPMLPSLLWARDFKGLSHPVIDDINKDIDWVDKWYPRSLEYIPEHLHEYFLKRLDHFGVQKMTKKELSSLENWVSDRPH